MMRVTEPRSDIDGFLARWLGQPGGAERSNTQLFICELCDVLGVARPTPASRGLQDDYVFERPVRLRASEGAGVFGRIDLYKRDTFILEAKQSRLPDEPPRPTEARDTEACTRRGRGLEGAGWDRLMRQARSQAESYVDHLPGDHTAPPFLIVCDVGAVFELYADFSGTGRGYAYFPDRRSHRIFLEDLRRPEVRDRLAAVWTEPHRLDPMRQRSRVTRAIARELAKVSQTLEESGKAAEEVAHFLVRCIFCMFAASVDLLPREAFLDLLDHCVEHPQSFALQMRDLWVRMNDPLQECRWSPVLEAFVPCVGGSLFHHANVLDLDRASLQAIRRAAGFSWAEVEPSIFGALLEGALKGDERRKLGAHYTPRAYVERLVRQTVLEPLRTDWSHVLARVQSALENGAPERARSHANDFLRALRRLRILDPACGTGNVLYVSLELVKALEAEVVETCVQLGAQEDLALDEIDPRGFLGLELNPRAAAIAELVLWIGFLQLHYRHRSGQPSEPLLRAHGAITHTDAVLDWTGKPLTTVVDTGSGRKETYPNPRRPDWPQADFIVGNPPFLGGKDLRTRLGDAYAEALWAAHPWMNRSADLVMYWWDHAASLLGEEGGRLRRFGFVTTNSLVQPFQRQTLARHLAGERRVRLVYAVADHPWTTVGRGAAAARVAMTVAEAGPGEGVRLEVTREAGLDTDTPEVEFRRLTGLINPDLTIGADLAAADALLANHGLCSPGVKLHGAGFIVSLDKARELGLGRRAGLERYIHPYRNGRDLVQAGRDAWVIDLYPLPAPEVRARFPEVYQHLQATVKPHRDLNRMAFRRENWWWFGATHEMYRSFTHGLARYICTPETAKHRLFVFLPGEVRADNMLVSIGSADAFHLGVLSSSAHRAWAAARGGLLEDRPRYTKSACFDPFPFPDPASSLRAEIAATAEELEATRHAVRREHADLTLTAIYNLMAQGGAERRQEQARSLILRELHQRLDRLVLQAYGWPDSTPREALLPRLAALNLERAAEEARGEVRWLRPLYQAARFQRLPRSASSRNGLSAPPSARVRDLFPRERDQGAAAVLKALQDAAMPLDVREVAGLFRGGGAGLQARIERALGILVRYGQVTPLPDGRLLARRAA